MQDDQVVQDQSEETTAEETTEQVQQTAPQPPQETEQARNFRQLKEARERAERERDEAIRYIKDMQSRQQTPQVVPEEDDEFSIGAEDVAEGKHVKAVYKEARAARKEAREAREDLKKYQQQSSETLAETRLKSLHPDADRVLSQSNISTFREKYPEMADTIYNSNGDMYSKMLSAYTMIKNLGVHHEDLFEADRNLAQKNAAKPRPLTSISPQQGDSPMSKANAFANGLTPELQKELWKETERYRKGY